MTRIAAFAAMAVAIYWSPAHAEYTTVDISPFAISTPDRGQGNYPTGESMGNLGSPVPFQLAGVNGVLRNYISPYYTASNTFDLTPYRLTGVSTVYALLNNIYGTQGVDEYDITISTIKGQSVTFQSIGGVDTRDFNQNTFTNTLAPTTLPWFDNSQGQRLDLRQFTLPTSFAGEVLAGFTITQNANGDFAFFSGLTVSTSGGIVPTGPTNPVATPEPASLALVSVGLLGFLEMRRRARG